MSVAKHISAVTQPAEPDYLRGFGNTAESEALPGALPRHQNSPRQVPMGLYAEQINGTSFTVPRAHNQRAWLYRIMPSVAHGPFEPLEHAGVDLAYLGETPTPDLVGWRPLPIPAKDAGAVDFVDGLHTIAGSGDPADERGLAVHIYAANAPMVDRAQSRRRMQTAVRAGGMLSLALAAVFIGVMAVYQWVPGWGVYRGGLWCSECMEMMMAAQATPLNDQDHRLFHAHLAECSHCKAKHLQMSTQAFENGPAWDTPASDAASKHARPLLATGKSSKLPRSPRR